MDSTNQRVLAVLAAAAIVVLLVFIGVNFQEVQIDFVIVQADVQLAFALLLAALLGFLAGLASFAFRR